MRRFLPFAVFIGMLGLFGFGIWWNSWHDARYVPSPLIDKPAPAFTLQSLKDPNQTLTRDILLGQVSLVNVWASWCPSCREEHPELMRIARETDIQVIGFDWKDNRPDALAMLQELGNPYAEILYDPDNRSGIDWGVYGAPETFIVDQDGIIRYKHVGPVSPEVWGNTLAPIIERLRANKP